MTFKLWVNCWAVTDVFWKFTKLTRNLHDQRSHRSRQISTLDGDDNDADDGDDREADDGDYNDANDGCFNDANNGCCNDANDAHPPCQKEAPLAFSLTQHPASLSVEFTLFETKVSRSFKKQIWNIILTNLILFILLNILWGTLWNIFKENLKSNTSKSYIQRHTQDKSVGPIISKN